MMGIRTIMKVFDVMLGFIALCLLASCSIVSDTTSDAAPDTVSDTAQTTKLAGFTPTCLEPGNIEKAEAAADRGDFAAWQRMNCGGLTFDGVSVRVIRCAANSIPVQMKLFSGLAPPDESLPDEICEVVLLLEDGSAHIAYTHYLNIMRSP